MNSVFEILIAALLLVGSFLMFVTGLGLIRMPDVYCRMHAAGKAGTLGISTVILAAVIYFAGSDVSITVRGLLAIFFQFLTTPTATHLLSHACYVLGYPHTERTAINELEPFIDRPPDAAPFGHE